jgi:predicted nucleic acid-binding protein
MRALLLDTNIWLRVVQPTAPQHAIAVDALAALIAQGATVYVTAQNVIEFWSVATRPVDANGLGWSVEAAAQEVERIMALFPSLDDTPAVFAHWQTLVAAHRVIGRRVHDARLVAVMLAHDVSHILTFNGDDFRGFNEIVVVEPTSVVAPSDS